MSYRPMSHLALADEAYEMYLYPMKEIRLLPGKEKALNRMHPWIFSGALRESDTVSEGDLVKVVSAKGEVVAIGHYQNPRASIRVKVLSFEDLEINET